MKLIVFFLTLVTFDLLGAEPAATLRDTVNINREWRFALGDVTGAEAPGFDDGAWSRVGLPHSFSIPYFQASRFYTGYGWYRKSLFIPASMLGKRLSLEFDGVFQVAEVFVNGTRVGEHRGGYTGFSFDITDAAKPGADNIVAVRVNNLWDARLAPRAGEHVFSGGIYRDARLIATAPLHVTWYGTFVTTPRVSKESATVNVKTEVVNASGTPKTATALNRIFAPDGRFVTQVYSAQVISAGATVTFDQTAPAISAPRLWSPETPAVYSVRTLIYDGNTPVDSYESPLGIRSVKWAAKQGVFLNGEHYYLLGANVHQDQAGWGDAVTQGAARRDVELVKEAGFNFIRGSHYPHSPAFVRACDELGICLWSESVFWGIGGPTGDGFWTASPYPVNAADQEPFEQSVFDQTREMIRMYRNDPSVVVWSTGNEVFFSDQSVLPKVRVFLTKIMALIHGLDPTRLAGCGGVQRGDLDKLDDAVAGYNGDGARLFIDPGVPNLVSEYGSVSAVRPGKYEPGWGDLPAGPGDKSKPYFWRYPWRGGEAVWCAFDHGSIASTVLGSMGLVDYFRLPKRAWYWYRNEYRKIPPPAWPVKGEPAMLSLTSDKKVILGTDATDDAHLIVTVLDGQGKPINNSPPVTLAVESGPGEFPTGPSITFEPQSDIAIRDGQAAIAFRSYYGGQTVIRATSPGLEPATLTIATEGQPAYVPGRTPPVLPRPYKRYDGSAAPVTPAVANIVALRPTNASSEAPGHSARLANDNDPATLWQAGNNAAPAWWLVDLENVYTISRVRLTFPSAGSYRYRIEMSEDKSNWKIVSDQSNSGAFDKVRTHSVDKGARGRFLRITFTALPQGRPAALADVQALQ